MQSTTIRFIRRGELVSLRNVPPERTLLELLREDLGLTGTKEGCADGDCGACTVVLGELAHDAGRDAIRYRAINSCIRLAHSIDGMALWSVEDLAAQDGTLHPAQEAMVRSHGSQCGFCTPGFVMSLFGMYQNHVVRGEAITRELAQEELSGNLCRCTGYRPILDAAQQMAELPAVRVDEEKLLGQLKAIQATECGHPGLEPGSMVGAPGWIPEPAPDLIREPAPDLIRGQARDDRQSEPVEAFAGPSTSYLSPRSLPSLLAARAAHPDAQIVAGCTDAGLWVTKMQMQFEQVIDVTGVAELLRVEQYDNHIAIGAAVTLTDAFNALAAERPQLKTFFNRFAGLPVRNAGTLGGNVANGSPIGDSMPLLIALRSHVVLMSVRGHREMPLEDFYTGYRKNVLAPDEVLAWIKVPRPHPHPLPEGEGGGEGWGEGREFLRAYKISKRYDDDISAVCLVLNVTVQDNLVAKISIGAGGVAATPARAAKTEAFLAGKPWSQANALHAANELRAEFHPIGDMRASAAYRSEVLGNLVQRFWLESQGMGQINLESAAWAVMPGSDPASTNPWIAGQARNDNVGSTT